MKKGKRHIIAFAVAIVAVIAITAVVNMNSAPASSGGIAARDSFTQGGAIYLFIGIPTYAISLFILSFIPFASDGKTPDLTEAERAEKKKWRTIAGASGFIAFASAFTTYKANSGNHGLLMALAATVTLMALIVCGAGLMKGFGRADKN